MGVHQHQLGVVVVLCGQGAWTGMQWEGKTLKEDHLFVFVLPLF